MSFQSKDRDDIYQSAQTYGRNEGCLVDYCGPPFRFQDHLRLIQDTYSPTVSHDLISQSGLEALDLSDYVIDPSKFDAGQTLDLCASYDINQNADIPSSLTKQVPLPLETPMLKSDPADDLRLYLRDVQRTRSCDMVDQWLPLSPTRDKRDEGLVFPESTSRFRLLLYRELDRESISTSRGASVLVTDVQNMCPPAILDNFSPAMEPIAEPVTPPFSPISEDNPPLFFPDRDVCFIDLTSEPMSPPGPEVDNVRNCLLGDQIELDGAEAEYGLLTHNSPTLLLAYENNEPHLDSLRLEVPAIREPSSPNAENAIDILAEHAVGVQGASDAIDNGDGKIESFFEDALIETLNAHRSMANAIVEQEKYDPVDSFARVRVPVMDFRLPRPDWEANGSDPKSQFSHMILDSLAPMLLPTSLTSTSLDAKLKWVPIAHDSGHFRVAEQLGTLSTESQALLDSNSVRINTSSSHIRQSAKPAIFELYSDDYIECEHVCESQDVVSPFFIATSPTTETLPEVQPITSTGPSLMDLVRNKRQGMMADNTASPIEEGQIMNTGKLLSNFMELRSIKRPRLSSRILNTGSIELRTPGQSASSQPSSAVGPSEIVQQAVKEPSPAPKAQIPDEKAKYIVSVDLARSILSYLETVWPPENLIDRQFSDQRNIGFLSTESNQVEGPGQLSFEADITLTVGVGLITTSMPKARQRPLPGSDKLPQLRGRVVELSTKYEKLIVLISEVNPSGEFVGELSAFDLAAYTDFVRFTIGLDASISTYLVPGTYDTMARWVLAFICRYSLAALRTSRYLSAPETTWELFFRHAGMNVAAAQVLSSVLFEQAGDRGLAHFLAMSPKERLSRYSALLGGEKLLQRASQIIDQPWK